MGKMLPNTGIEILCLPVRVKVLKSRNRSVPHPGRNISRRKYWSQKQSGASLPLIVSGVVTPPSPNLICHWRHEGGKISLALAQTYQPWEIGEPAKVAWNLELGDDLECLATFDADDGGDINIESLIDEDELRMMGDEE